MTTPPPSSAPADQYRIVDDPFVLHHRIDGAGQGPLTGLRLAVKDLFDVEGLPTACGTLDWPGRNQPAARTAPTVQALLDAGATVVGKTITDELACSLVGTNLHYGTPRNPITPDRVPGGSSSGSAAAVAGGWPIWGSARTPADRSASPASTTVCSGCVRPMGGSASRAAWSSARPLTRSG